MTIQTFEQRAAETVPSNEWNQAALISLYAKLYLYILSKVRQAKRLRAGTREWAAMLYLVCLTIHFTPLRLLSFLEEDPDLQVRVPDDFVRNGGLSAVPQVVKARAMIELELDGVIHWAVASWRACH